MKIRSAAAPGSTRAAGNTFIAVDDLENRLGSCRAEPTVCTELWPERPFSVRISAEGDESARFQLLGTALTRAMVLSKESGMNARIYAECPPDEQEALDLYRMIGLIDDDALVRMSRRVVAGPNVVRLPEGCTFIADDLTDAQERAFFLDRQRQLFSRENAEKWLEEISRKPRMKRLLLVSRDGLAGELVCWTEGGEGVVGMVYVAPVWRRKGVGTHLMEAARQYFFHCGLTESHVDVQTRMTPMLRMAATAGYRRGETLLCLPGMNLDAGK